MSFAPPLVRLDQIADQIEAVRRRLYLLRAELEAIADDASRVGDLDAEHGALWLASLIELEPGEGRP